MPREFMVATFSDERMLREGLRRVTGRGFRVYDVYTPYPVHGLDDALRLRRSRLPILSLVAGLGGLVAALALELYCAVFDWPLNVGGKPANSTLAFVPIAFELTILSSGLATAAGFLARCRLFPGAGATVFAAAATDDVFALVLRRRDVTFDAGEARRLLLESGARDVSLRELA